VTIFHRICLVASPYFKPVLHLSLPGVVTCLHYLHRRL